MGLRLSVLFESIVFRQLRFFMRGNNLEGLVRVPSSCCFSGKLLSWTTGLEWAAEYADLHPPHPPPSPPPPPCITFPHPSAPKPSPPPVEATMSPQCQLKSGTGEWEGVLFFFFCLSVQDLSISLDISLMRYVRVHFKIKQTKRG